VRARGNVDVCTVERVDVEVRPVFDKRGEARVDDAVAVALRGNRVAAEQLGDLANEPTLSGPVGAVPEIEAHGAAAGRGLQRRIGVHRVANGNPHVLDRVTPPRRVRLDQLRKLDADRPMWRPGAGRERRAEVG